MQGKEKPMLHCEKCGVDIAGRRRYCPLCQNELNPGEEASEETFPLVPTVYRRHHFLFCLLIFVSIAVVVVSVAVNLMLPQSGAWSAFVVGGFVCLWLSLTLAIRKRKNIPKNMLNQTVFLSAVCVCWDFGTGWHGWSLDYVVPILCMAAMAAMGILAKVLGWDVDNLLIYVCIDAVFGIVPIVFFLAGWLRVPYPSVICAALSLISLAALAVFRSASIWAELKRRLHL